jgi:hypothetical protein
MFGTMLLDVGVLLLVSGFIAVYRHHIKAGHARRALELPPVPVAAARDDRHLRISGRIVASDEGCLTAPCSGASAVWFRVRLWRIVARPHGPWAIILEQTESASFYVDDGSGQRAKVKALGPNVYAETTGFNQVLERTNAFLNERGANWSDGDRCEEECLRPGDDVSVVGFLQREPGVLQPMEYRDGMQDGERVVRGAPEHELIVGTPAALRRERGGVYRGGRIAMAIGALAMVAGLIARGIAPE